MDPDWRCISYWKCGYSSQLYVSLPEDIQGKTTCRAVEHHMFRLVEAAISVWEKLPRRSPSANRWSNCAPGSFSANRWPGLQQKSKKSLQKTSDLSHRCVFQFVLNGFVVKMAKHVDFKTCASCTPLWTATAAHLVIHQKPKKNMQWWQWRSWPGKPLLRPDSTGSENPPTQTTSSMQQDSKIG